MDVEVVVPNTDIYSLTVLKNVVNKEAYLLEYLIGVSFRRVSHKMLSSYISNGFGCSLQLDRHLDYKYYFVIINAVHR